MWSCLNQLWRCVPPRPLRPLRPPAHLCGLLLPWPCFLRGDLLHLSPPFHFSDGFLFYVFIKITLNLTLTEQLQKNKKKVENSRLLMNARSFIYWPLFMSCLAIMNMTEHLSTWGILKYLSFEAVFWEVTSDQCLKLWLVTSWKQRNMHEYNWRKCSKVTLLQFD